MSIDEDLPALAGAAVDLPRLAVAVAHEERPLARVHPAWTSHAAQLEVRSVACAPDGDVWLATAGGVQRWHAGLERYTRFGSEHGLPGNATRAVAVAGDGDVWALSDAGRLARLAGEEWTPAGTAAGLATAADGSVWAASDGALRRLHGPASGPDAMALAGGPGAPRVFAVGADVWVAGAEGVFGSDALGWRRRLRDPAVTALVRDARGLWIGSAFGLAYADLERDEWRVPANVPAGAVTALAPAPDGVWAAIGDRVGRVSSDGWSSLPGAGVGAVTALAAGAGGEVLIGTRTGLLRASEHSEPVPVATERPPEAASVPTLVQALALDGPNLWIGTAAGLFSFDEGRWRRVADQRVGDVRALAAGADGRLWVGGFNDGLRPLDAGVICERVRAVTGPLTAIAPALAGGVWAGGAGGVFRGGDGNEWRRVLGPEQLGSLVRTLLDGPRGLWIGTAAGLLCLDGATLTEPEAPLHDVRALLASGDDLLAGTSRGLRVIGGGPVPGLEREAITALTAHGDAVLVGTTHGLYRAERVGGWTAMPLATAVGDGLAADRVTALVASADRAFVWIGTVNGLSCLAIEE